MSTNTVSSKAARQNTVEVFINVYIKINFNRSQNIEGLVIKILYDPNRSANIAYIKNEFQLYLVLSPEGLKIN